MATALLVAGSTLTFWIPRFASTSSYSSVVQSARNCRQLAYGSFRLAHMSRDDHAVELIEPWRPKRRQNIITALTTLPQGWVSARKHQCTTAITTMWTESLGQGSFSIIRVYRKKICRGVVYLIVLCDHPSLVSVLFAVLLSLHLVTF